MTTLMQASNQWRNRPADERFLNLHELLDKVSHEHGHSREHVVSSRKVAFKPGEDQMNQLLVYGPNGADYELTHYSMGQVSSLAGAPAGYLRKLPAAMAADCLNYGMQHERSAQDVKVLLTKNGGAPVLRAATGPAYGRIWNDEIVFALIQRFGDGRTGMFRVPGEFGQDVAVTRENTTIYGSDRDMFVFLADEKNRIELPNRRDGKPGSLARGFFVWNSEVGDKSVGAAFFLFDYVCCNRIVWGVDQFKEIRIRHTVSAPDRWLDEISPVLVEYADSSAKPVLAAIEDARSKKIDDVQSFLSKRFTAGLAQKVMAAHEADEGRPIENMWDVVTGMTAAARNISWQDERIALEREAGKLLQ